MVSQSHFVDEEVDDWWGTRGRPYEGEDLAYLHHCYSNTPAVRAMEGSSGHPW